MIELLGTTGVLAFVALSQYDPILASHKKRLSAVRVTSLKETSSLLGWKKACAKNRQVSLKLFFFSWRNFCFECEAWNWNNWSFVSTFSLKPENRTNLVFWHFCNFNFLLTLFAVVAWFDKFSTTSSLMTSGFLETNLDERVVRTGIFR